MTARTLRFRSVVLDFDSTISALEGAEWIAATLSPEVASVIAAEVDAAMAGTLALQDIYAGRMNVLRPDARLLAELAGAYRAAVAPGTHEALDHMRRAGVQLRVVSGGFREAILPVAVDLGFAPTEVHAVSIYTSPDGAYEGFDSASPLVQQLGKSALVASLDLPRPSLMVGDGATDAAARPAVDAFAAFTGFARRGPVVAVADHVVHSFAVLEQLVLG